MVLYQTDDEETIRHLGSIFPCGNLGIFLSAKHSGHSGPVDDHQTLFKINEGGETSRVLSQTSNGYERCHVAIACPLAGGRI